MDRNPCPDADRRQPFVPPAIGGNADTEHAADPRRDGGDSDNPGERPDEIVPANPDDDRPGGTPDEVTPGQGDFDRPDSAPMENPPPPATTPGEMPPPD